MAEGNGNERDARIERLQQEHEEFQRDLKQLLTAQVIQKTQIDDLLKITQEHTRQLEAESVARREKDAVLDARVDKLVSAIGEFIS
jgi:hypothetical protein